MKRTVPANCRVATNGISNMMTEEVRPRTSRRLRIDALGTGNGRGREVEVNSAQVAQAGIVPFPLNAFVLSSDSDQESEDQSDCAEQSGGEERGREDVAFLLSSTSLVNNMPSCPIIGQLVQILVLLVRSLLLFRTLFALP